MIQEENFQIWLYTRYESLKKKKRILIGYLLNLLYKKGIIDSYNIYSGFSPETYEEVTKGKKKPTPSSSFSKHPRWDVPKAKGLTYHKIISQKLLYMDHQAIGVGGILHLLFTSGRNFIVISGA
jgi:hypothetical protein